MVRDAAATRARIVEAAIAEFSERGLAGARVDRIAARAEANKQLIYAHFGSKEGLFDGVLQEVIAGLLDAVPFDADDLPGYAVRLYDYGLAHPDLIQLARWHGLERPGVMAGLSQAAESTARKLAAVAQAQRAGVVDDAVAPQHLLEQVLALVHAGNDGVFSEFAALDRDVPARREALRHSVSRLVEPCMGARSAGTGGSWFERRSGPTAGTTPSSGSTPGASGS